MTGIGDQRSAVTRARLRTAPASWPRTSVTAIGSQSRTQPAKGKGIEMRSVTVTLVDDLDQAKADETVSFSLDGRDYEIDLSRAHAGELRKMADRYIAAARKARTAVHPRSGRRTQADRERSRRIR